MDYHHFSSQSAPEPGLHGRQGYLEGPFSQSVPRNYNNTGYHVINGFATQSQANIMDLHPTQPASNSQRGVGSQHGHHLSLGHSTPSNNHIMAMYAQGQPLGLFTIHQSYRDTQMEPDKHYSHIPPPPPGCDFDMEEMYDHDLSVHGLIPAPHPHQFTTVAISDDAHLGYLHPSPLPVPVPPTQYATPEIFLPGSSLSDNPSRIHERYMDHRRVTTSGDPRTAESLLFAEDAPKRKRKPPAKINHYVSVQEIPQIEEPSSAMRFIPYSSTADATAGDGHSGESSGTPVPEEGIETFCMRSFPHDSKLREALQVIMNSRTAESQDLYRFLKNNEDGTDKPWECLFEGDSGRCGGRFRRRDTVVGHIYLVHIKMLPIACEGVCGDPKCSRRFSSAATRSSHARKGSVKCDKCHSLTSGRNIIRHQITKKCQRAAAAIAKVAR